MKTVRFYIHKLPFTSPHWGRESANTINLNDYVPVWTAEVKVDVAFEIEHTLEQLWREFNIFIPEHYAAPSMSVGDIVELRFEEETRFFAVCGIGWKEVKRS